VPYRSAAGDVIDSILQPFDLARHGLALEAQGRPRRGPATIAAGPRARSDGAIGTGDEITA
jgi:hypothetical protein